VTQRAAYVFTRSGAVWRQQQQLTAADGAATDTFGCSVSVSGDTAVIGASGKKFGVSIADQGAAYVFTRSGTVWSQQQELTASDGASGGSFGFGRSVAVSGDTAIIGAPVKDLNFTFVPGAAYIFTRSGT